MDLAALGIDDVIPILNPFAWSKGNNIGHTVIWCRFGFGGAGMSRREFRVQLLK
jgi:hypothetical protein